MKSPTPETKFAECIFQKQHPFVSPTLQIKYHGQANHDIT